MESMSKSKIEAREDIGQELEIKSKKIKNKIQKYLSIK